MTHKTNNEIRTALKMIGMPQWKLAELLGIAETTLCIKFRKELPEEEKRKIIDLIQKYAKGGM